jgi:hypothetical protein
LLPDAVRTQVTTAPPLGLTPIDADVWPTKDVEELTITFVPQVPVLADRFEK